MTIGIVSLWHNHPELLPFFQHMLSVDGWDKLIFVDNASDKGLQGSYEHSLDAIQHKRPGAHIDYLRMAENNVVKAWNAGAAQMGTDILVIMANDLLMLDARWVQIVTDGMKRMSRFQFQGPYIGQQLGQYYVDGCLTVWMREDWEKLGGLDEGYEHPGYWSDVDIAWRATVAGMRLRQTPCPVHHLTAWTSRAGLGDFEPAIVRNQQRFVAKRGY